MFETGFYNQGRGLESGLRAGTAVSNTIQNVQSGNAVKQAAARIQAGEDQQKVISELMAQSPQAAQQLMNLVRGQQDVDAGVQEVNALKQKVGMQTLQTAALPIFGALMTDDEKSRGELLNESAAVFEKQSPETANVIRQLGTLKGRQQFDAIGGLVKTLRNAGVFPDDPSHMLGGIGQSADIAKFEYWKQMNPNATPEQMREVYNKIIDPQARAFASGIGAGAAKIATEQGLTPTLANREQEITVARGRGEQQVSSEANAKKNGLAYQTYQTAIGQLEQAASQTATNPVAGLLPAVTANAQIMESAVSMMAPVLKEMFRQAGEGTFTDKDQELLLKMVPTRNEHPEAIKAKLGMIDNLVRAKLQQGSAQPAKQPRNFEQQYLGGGQ